MPDLLHLQVPLCSFRLIASQQASYEDTKAGKVTGPFRSAASDLSRSTHCYVTLFCQSA